MSNWKTLFLKYFDFNHNEKVDYWEIIFIVLFIIFFQLAIQIGGEYIYDKMFNKNVTIVVTITFINAVLYNPLNISIII